MLSFFLSRAFFLPLLQCRLGKQSQGSAIKSHIGALKHSGLPSSALAILKNQVRIIASLFTDAVLLNIACNTIKLYQTKTSAGFERERTCMLPGRRSGTKCFLRWASQPSRAECWTTVIKLYADLRVCY